MPCVVTAIAGGVVLGFVAGTFVPAGQAAEEAAKTTDTYRMLELFGDVFERVRSDYVEQISDEELIEAAVEGMLAHLDPHSTFLNKSKFRDMQVQTKGEFGGLGIEVTMEKGYVKVVSPIDETPAARAGIQAGDFITHLNSEPVQGLTLSEAVEKMRGPVKTNIVLTIRRGSQAAFDVTIVRDRIRIQSVRSRAEGNIGYVRITSFSEQTDKGLKKAIEKLRSEIGNDNVAGYILDLRNNPGGLLDQAVSVTDSFIEQGEIVSTRGRKEDTGQRFYATAGDMTDGKPLVVMINGGSASASEIVAGALQDHRRAILLGTKTFGKGSVQTIIPLGRSGAIKLTTQRYYTPSGHSIQAKGIDPDILVEQARLEKLDAAGPRRSERDLRGALQNEEDGQQQPGAAEPKKDGEADKPGEVKKDEGAPKPDAGAKKDGETDATPADETAKKDGAPEDYQLARAIDLLRGIALYKGRMVN